jgi:hypothetical protein
MGTEREVEIAALKLDGSARIFCQGCTELHTQDALWNTFKLVFRKRYKDVHTDQYHYVRLEMDRQEKIKARKNLQTDVGH